jgi:4,5-DOPA dioxygenase extradiol
MKQPSIFLPHGGGPCFFLNENGPVPPEWQRMANFLGSVIADLPERPKALLVISGHWEEPQFTVQTGKNPGLLYDYGGFPPHTYRLEWPAPGAPELAKRAAQLLGEHGLKTGFDAERGWDHGVFVPLKVAVPNADIPVAQLSLLMPKPGDDYDAQVHIEAGQALSKLRDEGVLIVGSGMSFHNMRLRDGSAQVPSDDFDCALTDVITDADPDRRNARLAEWSTLPSARIAHPLHQEEHLLPLMVAAGAGGNDRGQHLFRDHVIGWTVSAYKFG